MVMTKQEFLAATGMSPSDWLMKYRDGDIKESPTADCLYCSAMGLLDPIKVFLDDTRTPEQIYGEAGTEWTLVRTVAEAMRMLVQENVTHMSLDNDLGLGQPEGYTLVNWMIETGIWPKEAVYVHSANVVRAKQMKEDIARYFSP